MDDHRAAVIDAMVAHGIAEQVEVPEDGPRILDELFELAVRDVDRRRDLRAGLWCFGCSSAPRCGRYPIVGGDRVFVSTRSLTVSKSQLGWLSTCERRVAWDRLYAVQVHDYDEIDQGRGRAMGTMFHEMAAAAIMADDPAEAVAAACRSIAPSEAAELRRLWDNHCTLWDADGDPEAKAVEYPVGLTITSPSVHVDGRGRESTQPMAISMIGMLDVTGREPDGTPMVVEHRTGRSSDHVALEVDLYAVGAAEAIRARSGDWPDRVAIHLHRLGPEEPLCDRTVLGRDALERSLDRLRGAAETIAEWHPHDTLSPGFNVGRWCDGCRHLTICSQFR
jgi:hypothetical protein